MTSALAYFQPHDLIGPPEPIWQIPRKHVLSCYRIPRGAIIGADDAGDGMTFLTLSRASQQILVDVPIARLYAAMPYLKIKADRAKEIKKGN